MPELPEVETIRRQLDPLVVGRVVTEAWSHESGKFTAAREVTGATVAGTSRRGKYLMIELVDGRDLVVHLGMTGQLLVDGVEQDNDDPYVRAWWSFDDGSRLSFRDVRRFGRLAVIERGRHESIPTLAAMGPEPFDEQFDAAAFWGRLRASNQRIKTQLLSQRPVAGVGNIYADEALFRARLRRPPCLPREGSRAARGSAPGAHRRTRPWRHDPARLPQSRGGRDEPAASALLRASRTELRDVRQRAAGAGDRRPIHHLVPELSALTARTPPAGSATDIADGDLGGASTTREPLALVDVEGIPSGQSSRAAPGVLFAHRDDAVEADALAELGLGRSPQLAALLLGE